MKYTRYDYKRKKGDNFFVWIVVVIVLSVFIGMSIYNIFIGNGAKESSSEDVKQVVKNQDTTNNSTVTNDAKEFGIIQCGVFTKKENADSTMGTIPNEYPKLIVEDSGTFKVIAGIYDLQNSNEVSKRLNESSVNNFRISCRINEDTQVKKVESEIIDGYIKVVNQLYSKDVKCINTSKFKEWVNETLSNVDDKGEELQSLVDNISSLPDELKKEEVNNSVVLLYNILVKYKEN